MMQEARRFFCCFRDQKQFQVDIACMTRRADASTIICDVWKHTSRIATSRKNCRRDGELRIRHAGNSLL
jgi:hypothetical protein